MKNVTLDDVAKHAGVSRATVSRVVNNYPHVSERVRQQVLKTVKEMGYNPHMAARWLASNRTGNIGFVIPNSLHTFFSDPYFPQLTAGVAQACSENDYLLSLFIFHTPELEKQMIPRLTRGGLVDGIIVQSTDIDDTTLLKINEGKVPFVVAGRPLNLPQANYIDVDNVTGAYNAVAHLLRLGHRQIGTISGPRNTAVGQDRLKGYRQALMDRGISPQESWVATGDFTEQGGFYAAQHLLQTNPDLSALFVASDGMAIGAMRAIRQAGKGIPDDISIVSYDDLPPAQQAVPPLTTIRQPIQQLGRNAVEILLDIIEHGTTPPRQIILETELVIRQSCRSVLQTR